MIFFEYTNLNHKTHLQAHPQKNYIWHRNNDFPSIDICEVIFATDNQASGRTLESIDHPFAARIASQDIEEDSGSGSVNRSASDHDAKKKSNKKSTAGLVADFECIATALEKPIRMEKLIIQKASDAWIEEAMDIWDKEKDFKYVPLDVERNMKRSWRKDSKKALEFVKSKPAYRYALMMECAEAVSWAYFDPEDFPHGYPMRKGKGKEKARYGWVYIGNSDEEGSYRKKTFMRGNVKGNAVAIELSSLSGDNEDYNKE